MMMLQRQLNQLRAALAQTECWSAPWMKAWINEAHLSGELARLKAGLTSCGCDLCRESHATAQACPGVTKVKGDTGRPPKPLSRDEILELRQAGLGYRRIAGLMGTSHMTIKRRLCGT